MHTKSNKFAVHYEQFCIIKGISILCKANDFETQRIKSKRLLIDTKISNYNYLRTKIQTNPGHLKLFRLLKSKFKQTI